MQKEERTDSHGWYSFLVSHGYKKFSVSVIRRDWKILEKKQHSLARDNKITKKLV